ncbi:DUF4112 domain-containing protein [Nisaea nitritireducens]|uniref:DUF4112 domain-containing protein n=1 Tax=Nisaea nitritireducens TaxID=568392 RepID=UPI00186782B7|nr:DUF4112 domain-containing protein [Nisaea nitritireducens]
MKAKKPAGRCATACSEDRQREIDRLETLAYWLDSRFRVPGTDIRFGLDALAGLIPGLGDGTTALFSIYIVIQARRLGVPFPLRARMAANTAIDLVIGAVPLVGDIFDVGFKANLWNAALLREHFAREVDAAKGSQC